MGETTKGRATMRRGLGLVLCAGLLVGGAAACSDDDSSDGGGSTTTAAPLPTTTAGDGGDDTGTTAGGDGGGDTATTEGGDTGTTEGGDDPVVAANDELIQRFCEAQDEYNAALQDSLDAPDDGALQDRVRELSGTLGELSDELAAKVPDFTPEQAEQFRQCQAGE